MKNFKQVHELHENETGELILMRNGKQCICPFAGQHVLPVPNKLSTHFDLQRFVKTCDNGCPLFTMYVNDENDLATIELRCTASEVHIPSVKIRPFPKNPNLIVS